MPNVSSDADIREAAFVCYLKDFHSVQIILGYSDRVSKMPSNPSIVTTVLVKNERTCMLQLFFLGLETYVNLFLLTALRIPTTHDFCVISARTWAHAYTT